MHSVQSLEDGNREDRRATIGNADSLARTSINFPTKDNSAARARPLILKADCHRKKNVVTHRIKSLTVWMSSFFLSDSVAVVACSSSDENSLSSSQQSSSVSYGGR